MSQQQDSWCWTWKNFNITYETNIKNKTLIVITHRFAALDLVDRIIVLNQGKVVADGPKNLVLASLQEKR